MGLRTLVFLVSTAGMAATPSVWAADHGDVGGLTKTAPSSDLTSETGVRAARIRNHNRIDGVSSDRTTADSVQVRVNQGFAWGGLSLAVEQLSRNATLAADTREIDKSTSIITPGFNVKATPAFTVTAGFAVFRTDVVNERHDEGEYDLNTQRSMLRGTWLYGKGEPGDGDAISLTLASEARADKTYALGDTRIFDQDYIPAQAELAYTRNVNKRVTVTSTTRYSHYNADVYEERFDSNVPSSPTLAQVVEYLLSFKVAARLAVTSGLALVGEASHKAAVDTNSFTGDEYLVGTGGAAGVEARLGSFDAGLKYATSNGRKTHETSGQRFDMANRQSTVAASLAVSM